jgi:hypothetical protein
MGDTVKDDRLHARIKQEDFQRALGGRIVVSIVFEELDHLLPIFARILRKI